MERQPKSGEAGSCCEARKEALGKAVFPLGDQVKQLAGAAQRKLPLRTAGLVRRHGAHKAVAGGGRGFLQDQFPAHAQRSQLASQPSQQPPDGRMVQRPFFNA